MDESSLSSHGSQGSSDSSSNFFKPFRNFSAPGRLLTQYSFSPKNDFTEEQKNVFLFHALLKKDTFKTFRARYKGNVTEETLGYLRGAAELFSQLQKLRQNHRAMKNSRKSASLPGLTLRGSENSSIEPGQNDKEIMQSLRANAMMFLLAQIRRDPQFLLTILSSFGEHKHEAIAFFLSEQLSCLVLPSDENSPNIKLAVDVVHIITACLETADYAFHCEEVSVWTAILFQYMDYYHRIPDIFFGSSGTVKYLSLLSVVDIENFVSRIKKLGMEQQFFDNVMAQFSLHHNVSLARMLFSDFRKQFITTGHAIADRFAPLIRLLREYNEVIFFYTLLELKNRFVDLVLMADPRFIAFIQAQNSEVGCKVRGELLMRLKLAFQYDSLAQDATDERQMTASVSLAEQSKYAIPAFLSQAEVGRIVLTRVLPGEKASRGAEWLVIYQEYLSLVINAFLPHIEGHFHEVAQLHAHYLASTIRITTSQEPDRFDPEKYHRLDLLPSALRHYCESNSSLMKDIQNVFKRMNEKYREINGVMEKTLRIGQDQDSFRPVLKVAEQMLAGFHLKSMMLPSGKIRREPVPQVVTRSGEFHSYPVTQFSVESFTDALIILIVDACRHLNGVALGICTEELAHSKDIYIKISVAEQLVEEFKRQLGKLMNLDGSFPENGITEDTIKITVDTVCAELVKVVLRRKSVEESGFFMRRKLSSSSERSRDSFEDCESESSQSSLGNSSRKSSLK